MHISLKDAEESIQRKALSYNEDDYYDFLSAFCKSLRGSDANAALYYAMRLIEGGCDPMLVARRLVVHSAEDVGMADPVPPYLKDNSFGSREDKAQSLNYKFPHNYGGYVEQQYLPDSLKDKVYYVPGNNGYENTVKEIRERKGKKR